MASPQDSARALADAAYRAFSELGQVVLLRAVGQPLAGYWSSDWLRMLEVFGQSQARVYIDGAAHGIYEPSVSRFGDITYHVNHELLQRMASSGGSLVVEEVRQALQWAEPWARALEDVFLENVWLNVFVAFGDRGIPPHWDDNNVAVVQLAGRRRWTISAPNPKDPVAISRQPETHSQRQNSYTLSPGDALLVPRGYVHSTVAPTSNMSTHLMFAFRRRTYWDFLHWLIDRAAEGDAAIRADLRNGDRVRIGSVIQSITELNYEELLQRYCTERSETLHNKKGRWNWTA